MGDVSDDSASPIDATRPRASLNSEPDAWGGGADQEPMLISLENPPIRNGNRLGKACAVRSIGDEVASDNDKTRPISLGRIPTTSGFTESRHFI